MSVFPAPSPALSVYRAILRSAGIVFRGDPTVLVAARQQARASFLENAMLKPEDPAFETAITHAREVAEILRKNVVQGYDGEGQGQYKLRIHEDTERGDNDTIKMPNGKKVVIDGKPCSER